MSGRSYEDPASTVQFSTCRRLPTGRERARPLLTPPRRTAGWWTIASERN